MLIFVLAVPKQLQAWHGASIGASPGMTWRVCSSIFALRSRLYFFIFSLLDVSSGEFNSLSGELSRAILEVSSSRVCDGYQDPYVSRSHSSKIQAFCFDLAFVQTRAFWFDLIWSPWHHLLVVGDGSWDTVSWMRYIIPGERWPRFRYFSCDSKQHDVLFLNA